MSQPRPFRFGVSVNRVRSKEEWVATARKAESLGYSTLLMPDHLGNQLAPFAALMAAAEATQKLRIGSLVFDNDFRHRLSLPRRLLRLTSYLEGVLSWDWELAGNARSTSRPVFLMSQQECVSVGWKKLCTSSKACLPMGSVLLRQLLYSGRFRGYPKPCSGLIHQSLSVVAASVCSWLRRGRQRCRLHSSLSH